MSVDFSVVPGSVIAGASIGTVAAYCNNASFFFCPLYYAVAFSILNMATRKIVASDPTLQNKKIELLCCRLYVIGGALALGYAGPILTISFLFISILHACKDTRCVKAGVKIFISTLHACKETRCVKAGIKGYKDNAFVIQDLLGQGLGAMGGGAFASYMLQKPMGILLPFAVGQMLLPKVISYMVFKNPEKDMARDVVFCAKRITLLHGITRAVMLVAGIALGIINGSKLIIVFFIFGLLMSAYQYSKCTDANLTYCVKLLSSLKLLDQYKDKLNETEQEEKNNGYIRYLINTALVESENLDTLIEEEGLERT